MFENHVSMSMSVCSLVCSSHVGHVVVSIVRSKMIPLAAVDLRKMCSLKPTFRHTAGTCCTGHSSQGKKLRTQDVTIIYQICFMALRLEMEEAEVVQENVESFPVAELIGRFMSQAYFIDQEILDPLFYGMPVSRRRLYVKLFHGGIYRSQL